MKDYLKRAEFYKESNSVVKNYLKKDLNGEPFFVLVPLESALVLIAYGCSLLNSSNFVFDFDLYLLLFKCSLYF